MPTPTSSLNAFVATATKAARLAAREITRAAQDRDLVGNFKLIAISLKLPTRLATTS